MSQETASRSLFSHLTTFVVIWGVLPLILLIVVLILLVGGGTQRTNEARKGTESRESAENHLAEIRSILTSSSRQADLATCRSLIPLLNAHLQQREQLAGTEGMPKLSASDQQQLSKWLTLDKAELAEITSPTFTPLDAHHLEACFLLRDAARSLDATLQIDEKKIVRQTPLDRAVAGFAWAVRQVRLATPGQPLPDEPVPVSAVLHRSFGTALERGLVFLGLLEQLGQQDEASSLQGCLIFCPDDRGERRLWACGVAIGSGESGLYLFDPRLGLPIPGPRGEGVATLAQFVNDPTISQQLSTDKLSYDVRPEQARKAELELVIPLSALAPRVEFLQTRLLRDRTFNEQPLPPAVTVHLAESPSRAQESVQNAVKSLTPPPRVGVWREGTSLLRRFLPREEGGSDEGKTIQLGVVRGYLDERDPLNLATPRMSRQRIYQLLSVPWQEFPALFRDPARFRPDFGPGQLVRDIYAGPFVRSLTDPSLPRGQMLRGRYARIIPELVRDKDQALAQRERLKNASDLTAGLREWLDRANEVFAELSRARGTPEEAKARAQVNRLLRPGDPIEVYLSGVMAGPLGAQTMYYLALCKHEQAVRSQARVELAERSGIKLADERANAQKIWLDTESQWMEFLEANPGRPGLAAATRLRAEAQLQLGRREQALTTLRQVDLPMTDLERLAQLLQVRKLEAAK